MPLSVPTHHWLCVFSVAVVKLLCGDAIWTRLHRQRYFMYTSMLFVSRENMTIFFNNWNIHIIPAKLFKSYTKDLQVLFSVFFFFVCKRQVCFYQTFFMKYIYWRWSFDLVYSLIFWNCPPINWLHYTQNAPSFFFFFIIYLFCPFADNECSSTSASSVLSDCRGSGESQTLASISNLLSVSLGRILLGRVWGGVNAEALIVWRSPFRE